MKQSPASESTSFWALRNWDPITSKISPLLSSPLKKSARLLTGGDHCYQVGSFVCIPLSFD